MRVRASPVQLRCLVTAVSERVRLAHTCSPGLICTRIPRRPCPDRFSPPNFSRRPCTATSAISAWWVCSTTGARSSWWSSSASAWPRGWTRSCGWPAGKCTRPGSRTRRIPAARGSNRWTPLARSPRTAVSSGRFPSSSSISSSARPLPS